MKVTKLELKNFRNYKDEKFIFENGINLLYGDNAQGKTNVLEAIYLISSLKSHRAKNNDELIYDDEKFFYIKANVNKNNDDKILEYDYNLKQKNKKNISVNEIKIKKYKDYIGTLNSVFFAPEDLKIIKGAPAERRRFINILLSQIDKKYFIYLQKYNKIIKHKNVLLKQNLSYDIKKKQIEVWNDALIDVAKYIIDKRIKTIDIINSIISLKSNKLTNNNETITISYLIDGNKKYGLCYEIDKKIENNIEKEIELGYSIVGPHRDDIEILINNKNIKKYGSQGQQRTAVLALKLSEIDIIKQEKDDIPILLLDDVFSELDNNRKEFLLEYIKNIQTFITSTKKEKINEISYFYIKNGNSIKEN